MYTFLIIAYNAADEDGMTLKQATEICLTAESAAKALEEARRAYIAKNYFIKRIEKWPESPPILSPTKNVLEEREKR